ncbi:NHL repeat-containing protein [Pseudotamlana agarivorans]|uniref:hypothetical protein n=1 Tax=Pseudotamlana agarivorans TaxID=481183 RepID=UPI00082E4DC9|nr:hypothetical protein [Tamlana agarivorans]
MKLKFKQPVKHFIEQLQQVFVLEVILSKAGIDEQSTIYVADSKRHVIWKKETADMHFKKFAGSGQKGFQDGLQTAACFNHPILIGIDEKQNCYIHDKGNACVRKISPYGETITLSGLSSMQDDLFQILETEYLRFQYVKWYYTQGQIYILNILENKGETYLTIYKNTRNGVKTTIL